MIGVGFPDLRYGQGTDLRSHLAGDFYVGGDHLRIGRLDDRKQFPRFADRLFQIGSFQADAFAFAVDLITEIVVAALASLIDGPGFQFDAVKFGIHFAPSHDLLPND